MKNLLSIYSTGYSGSTLVSLIVGAHSKAFYLGEFHSLARYCKENGFCGCGKMIKECSFWKEVRGQYKERTGLDFFTHPKDLLTYERFKKQMMLSTHEKYLFRFRKATGYLGNTYALLAPLKLFTISRWKKLIQTTMGLYNIISEISGSEILVDSTKSYVRTYELFNAYPDLIKVIFLVRDGRGVCHSNIMRGKHYRGISMAKAARGWKNGYIRGEKILSIIPDKSKLFLKYEELCIDPEKYAKKISDFMSMSFEPGMLNISKGVGHSIAGNRMKRQSSNEIILNEKWKDGLSLEDLNIFNKIAGSINQKYGYLS